MTSVQSGENLLPLFADLPVLLSPWVAGDNLIPDIRIWNLLLVFAA